MAETNTALESNYNPIKNKFKDGTDIKQQQQQQKKKQTILLQDLTVCCRKDEKWKCKGKSINREEAIIFVQLKGDSGLYLGGV